MALALLTCIFFRPLLCFLAKCTFLRNLEPTPLRDSYRCDQGFLMPFLCHFQDWLCVAWFLDVATSSPKPVAPKAPGTRGGTTFLKSPCNSLPQSPSSAWKRRKRNRVLTGQRDPRHPAEASEALVPPGHCLSELIPCCTPLSVFLFLKPICKHSRQKRTRCRLWFSPTGLS